MKCGFVGLRMTHIRKIVRRIRKMKANMTAIMRRKAPRSLSWWPHSFVDMVVVAINCSTNGIYYEKNVNVVSLLVWLCCNVSTLQI
jgi:hypothetical protein